MLGRTYRVRTRKETSWYLASSLNRFRKCYSVNEMTLDFPITHYFLPTHFFVSLICGGLQQLFTDGRIEGHTELESSPTRIILAWLTKEVIKTEWELIEQVTFRDFFNSIIIFTYKYLCSSIMPIYSTRTYLPSCILKA